MKYTSTHPWLKFGNYTSQILPNVWAILGECTSKIDHILHSPLSAEMRELMHSVFLAKGVQATTAIEGNTLTDEQIRAIIENRSTVPISLRYQEQEVANILRLFEEIRAECVSGHGVKITPKRICSWNRRILEGIETDGVPGSVRDVEVGVSNYLGAPAQDCQWLLARLCRWNEELQKGHDEELKLSAVSNAIMRAIIMHLYFVWIHPFIDGNGRTARLIEYAILLDAGVPTPAAHLLSNYYNRTRDMYYRRLDDASKHQNGMGLFIEYALTGLRDQLVDQLNGYIYPQLWHLTLKDQISELFKSETGKTAERRKLLIDAITADNAMAWNPVPWQSLRKINVDVAMKYSGLSDDTFRRDVEWLVKHNLLVMNGDKIDIALGGVVDQLPIMRNT